MTSTQKNITGTAKFENHYYTPKKKSKTKTKQKTSVGVMRQSFTQPPPPPQYHSKYPSSSSSSHSSLHRWLARWDWYAKVPADFLEGSPPHGRILSWVVLAILALLLVRETMAFWAPTLVADLQLDRGGGGAISARAAAVSSQWHSVNDDDRMDKIQVRFNITLMDLTCEVSESHSSLILMMMMILMILMILALPFARWFVSCVCMCCSHWLYFCFGRLFEID